MSQNIKEKFEIPWYGQGLHFKCTQCGKCCTGSPGFVWVTEEEIADMARFLKIEVAVFKRLYVRRVGQRYALVEKKSQNHSCVFYQNQQCKVYASRPLQCRAYPFWQENLLSPQHWEQTTHHCEGIQPEAPLISYETIQEFLEEQSKQGPQEHFVT